MFRHFLEESGKLRRAVVPDYVQPNGHMYNIVLPDDEVRIRLVDELKKRDMMAYICYVPLHYLSVQPFKT